MMMMTVVGSGDGDCDAYGGGDEGGGSDGGLDIGDGGLVRVVMIAMVIWL